MAMGRENISKTKTCNWEVHGWFDFSPNGGLLNKIRVTLYIDAVDLPEAARIAVERMGPNPTIKKIFQMFESNEED